MINTLELARMIDHSLLSPSMTDKQMEEGCKLALKYKVATVCIKPYAVKLAREILSGSEVKVCTVVGFPHGNSSIEVKNFETLKACQDGAVEIDMVVNTGKVLGNDWAYVKEEIETLNNTCKNNNAILKVIFENDYLPGDSYKIKLCQICNEINVAFVKTSTGFGFVKNSNGIFEAKGATSADLKLMREHTASHIQVKAAGGIRTLEDCARAIKSGVTRIGTSSTEAILQEAAKTL